MKLRTCLLGCLTSLMVTSCGGSISDSQVVYKFADFYPWVESLQASDIVSMSIKNVTSPGDYAILQSIYSSTAEKYSSYYESFVSYLKDSELHLGEMKWGDTAGYDFEIKTQDDVLSFRADFNKAIINGNYYTIDNLLPIDGDYSNTILMSDRYKATFSSFGVDIAEYAQKDLFMDFEFIEDKSDYVFDYTTRYAVALEGKTDERDLTLRIIDANHFFYNKDYAGSILYETVNGYSFSNLLESHPAEESFYSIVVKKDAADVLAIKCDQNSTFDKIHMAEIMAKRGYASATYTLYTDSAKTIPLSETFNVDDNIYLYI